MTWFCYDPDSGFEEFDSEAEAIMAAGDRISLYLEDGEWGEGVERIVVGQVTHRSEMCDIVEPAQRDENGYFNGKYYADGPDCWCDYKMTTSANEGDSEQ